MKYCLIFLAIFSYFFTFGCSSNRGAPVALYPESREFKKEQPLTFLVMPPINKTNNVDAKELFYSKMAAPVYSDGYYVFPPTLAMELMKKEGIYDAELFLNNPLNKFEELLGVDAVLFTIIYDTDKSKIRREGMVDIEFIVKSTATNKELYRIRGEYVLDRSLYTLDDMTRDMDEAQKNGFAYGAVVYPIVYGVIFMVDLVRTITLEEADVSGKVARVALNNLPCGIYPCSQSSIKVPKTFKVVETEKNGMISAWYKKFNEEKK